MKHKNLNKYTIKIMSISRQEIPQQVGGPEPKRLKGIPVYGCSFCDNQEEKPIWILNIGPRQDFHGWTHCALCKEDAYLWKREWMFRHKMFYISDVIPNNLLVNGAKIRRSNGDVEKWTFDLSRPCFYHNGDYVVSMINPGKTLSKIVNKTMLEELNPELHGVICLLREHIA